MPTQPRWRNTQPWSTWGGKTTSTSTALRICMVRTVLGVCEKLQRLRVRDVRQSDRMQQGVYIVLCGIKITSFPHRLLLLRLVSVTLFNCSVGRSDCSRCRTADPKYGCVWCGGAAGSRCVYQDSCTEEVQHTCPAPVIHFVRTLYPLLNPCFCFSLQLNVQIHPPLNSKSSFCVLNWPATCFIIISNAIIQLISHPVYLSLIFFFLSSLFVLFGPFLS